MCKLLCAFIYLNLHWLIGGANGVTFNCTQPPTFANADVNLCCRMPQINLGNVLPLCNGHINQLKSADEKYPAYAHVCYPECVYRETGALVDGVFRIENVKLYLQRNVQQGDKDIVPYIVRSFDSCLANIKAHMSAAGLKTYAKLSQGCSPLSSMVYACVNAETFLHCPATIWKNESQCNLAKSFVEQCNPLPHVPLPMN